MLKSEIKLALKYFGTGSIGYFMQQPLVIYMQEKFLPQFPLTSAEIIVIAGVCAYFSVGLLEYLVRRFWVFKV